VSFFCESINNNPDGIVTTVGCWKSSDKIHSYFFPFLDRDLQRLQKTGGTLMFCLNALTNVAPGNEECNITLHAMPPKGLLEILIHLGSSGVNGIGVP
jgi:hypothetical protein